MMELSSSGPAGAGRAPTVCSRRRAIGVAAAAVAALRARAVTAQTVANVRYGSTTLVDGVPLFYAQQTGMFRSEGLDVAISKYPSTSVISAAVVGGSLDVGEITALPLINAHIRGLNLQIVFPNTIHYTGRPYNAAIIVGANAPYKTAKDLNGKTMSSAAVGDSAWIATRAFLDANGGDSSTIKFVEIPFSALQAAIESGRVDGGASVDPYLSQAIKAGKARSLGDFQAGFGPRVIQSTYSATAEYVAKNRDLLTRFARVARASHEYINNHRDDLVKYTEAFTGVEPAQQSPQAVNFTVNYTPKDLQPWIDAAARYKVIEKGFDAAELFAKLS
jgi:NitT/TauT family transport system substrate-binding protein